MRRATSETCYKVPGEAASSRQKRQHPFPFTVQYIYIHTYLLTYLHTYIHTYTHTYILHTYIVTYNVCINVLLC